MFYINLEQLGGAYLFLKNLAMYNGILLIAVIIATFHTNVIVKIKYKSLLKKEKEITLLVINVKKKFIYIYKKKY